jgi:hypothetical protein
LFGGVAFQQHSVDRHGARAVRAKQSAATREPSPGRRLDAGAAEAQVPKQETQSFPLADVIADGIARVD